MRVIVTGSTGFLGKHLLKFLDNKRCKVFTIGRKKSVKKNYFNLPKNYDISHLQKIFLKVKPDLIFHLAGDLKTSSESKAFKANTIFTYKLSPTWNQLNTCFLQRFYMQ